MEREDETRSIALVEGYIVKTAYPAHAIAATRMRGVRNSSIFEQANGQKRMAAGKALVADFAAS